MKTLGVYGAPNINRLLEQVVEGKYKVKQLNSRVEGTSSLFNRITRAVSFAMSVLSVDVVYFTYIEQRTGFYAKIAKLLNKKVVYHWAGTDVLNYLNHPEWLSEWKPKVDIHLAYAPNLQNELKTLGIESRVFTIVPKLKLELAAMPKEHAVLLSIPDDKPGLAEFYGYETMIKVIEEFPELEFVVVRSSHPEKYPYKNVRHMGVLTWDEMEKVYDNVSIVIRYPEHDGLSLLLMESTIKGKHMLYRYELPHTIHVSSFEDICVALRKLVDTPPEVNTEASEYGVKTYNQDTCLNELTQILEPLWKKEGGV